MMQHIDLEKYFSLFRAKIVGIDHYFQTRSLGNAVNISLTDTPIARE